MLDIDIIDMVDTLEWFNHVNPDIITEYQKLGQLLNLPGFNIASIEDEVD